MLRTLQFTSFYYYVSWLLVITLPLALAACIGSSDRPTRPYTEEVALRSTGGPAGSPERLVYSPPANSPPEAGAIVVSDPPERVIDKVVEALRSAGLSIAALDERRGLVVATFAGEPKLYVNCGKVRAIASRGGERTVDASLSDAVYSRQVGNAPTNIRRSLILSARLTIRVAKDAAGSRIDSRARYVLTKKLEYPQAEKPIVETINFQSGKRSRFKKGTICQATGALERMAVSGINV